MTHKDIYTKFMIEYDKANITSSYPSLTKYEVATLLDKAYLALIAQKMTGNNPRKSTFESDVKSIEDLRPLLKHKPLDILLGELYCSANESIYKLPDDMLYYVQSHTINTRVVGSNLQSYTGSNVTLVPHSSANNFRATSTNLPWMKNPVAFIDGDNIHLLEDAGKPQSFSEFALTYIKIPQKFTKLQNAENPETDIEVKFTFLDYAGNAVVTHSHLKPGYATPSHIKNQQGGTRTGYVFVGWYPAIPDVIPYYNVTFNPIYLIENSSDNPVDPDDPEIPDEPTLVSFTYLDWESATIAVYENLIPGEYTPEYAKHAGPARDGYTFVKWNPEIPDVVPSSNVTFNPVYIQNQVPGETDEPVTTVIWRFVDWKSDVFHSYNNLIPGQPTPNYIKNQANPIRDGYTFVRWDPEIPDTITPTDATFSGVYLKNPDSTITVTIRRAVCESSDHSSIVSNAIIRTLTCTVGELYTVAAEPIKDDDDYTYQFIGWYKNNEFETAMLSVTFTATNACEYVSMFERTHTLQPPVIPDNFVDLGLPSGTLWRNVPYADDVVELSVASAQTLIEKYKKLGYDIPTIGQAVEFAHYCDAVSADKGYYHFTSKLNGNYISIHFEELKPDQFLCKDPEDLTKIAIFHTKTKIVEEVDPTNKRELRIVLVQTISSNSLLRYKLNNTIIPEWGGTCNIDKYIYKNATQFNTIRWAQVVQLSATPFDDYRFDRWEDDATENVRHLQILNNTNTSAIFVPEHARDQYFVKIQSNNENYGTVDKPQNGYVRTGTIITVTPTAKPGYKFVKWSDNEPNNVNNTSRQFYVGDNIDVTAVFESATTYRVEIFSRLQNGGDVMFVPDTDSSQIQDYSGRNGYSKIFKKDQMVQVKAAPKENYEFVQWVTEYDTSDIQISKDSEYTFIPNDDTTLYADFTPKIMKTIVRNVIYDPDDYQHAVWSLIRDEISFDFGQTITLIARDLIGDSVYTYEFVGWQISGTEPDFISVDRIYQVVLDEPKEYIAAYKRIRKQETVNPIDVNAYVACKVKGDGTSHTIVPMIYFKDTLVENKTASIKITNADGLNITYTKTFNAGVISSNLQTDVTGSGIILSNDSWNFDLSVSFTDQTVICYVDKTPCSAVDVTSFPPVITPFN